MGTFWLKEVFTMFTWMAYTYICVYIYKKSLSIAWDVYIPCMHIPYRCCTIPPYNTVNTGYTAS